VISAAILAGTAAVTAQTTSPSAQAEMPVDYFFPDAPPGVTTYDNKFLTIRAGFVFLADYTFVGQDASSIEQVAP